MYGELPAEAHHLWTSKAFTALQMDVIKNVSHNKTFNHILVIVDCFTRYVVLYPLKTETADEVVQQLNNFIGHYGRPRYITSDGAPGFKADLTRAFATYYGYKIAITDPYRPTAHGIVERFNQEVQRHLRALDLESEKGWVELLPFVQHIINHSPSTVTGYPPAVAVFGRRALASELLANVAVDRENDVPIHPAEIKQLTYEEAYPYIAELDDRLARIRERSNIHLDQILQEKINQASPVDEDLSPGKLVLYKPDPPNSVRNKLSPIWHGPATIKEQSGGRYTLIDRTTNKEFYRPANQLKRFVCGPNPNLGDLLNAKDKDSQVVVGVQSHYPTTFKKSHRKSDLFFDMKIRQRNGKIVIKHLPYKLVKELKLVHEYMRRIPSLFPLVPPDRTLRTSRATTSSSSGN
jgi:hypothetical protein